MLDKKAKLTMLSQDEIDTRFFFWRNRLACLLTEEEIKWYQRVKTKDILKGDSNTKYFHLVANGKHRKSKNFSITGWGPGFKW